MCVHLCVYAMHVHVRISMCVCACVHLCIYQYANSNVYKLKLASMHLSFPSPLFTALPYSGELTQSLLRSGSLSYRRPTFQSWCASRSLTNSTLKFRMRFVGKTVKTIHQRKRCSEDCRTKWRYNENCMPLLFFLNRAIGNLYYIIILGLGPYS